MRTAEDLDTHALTFAEIKAIASGNPAVMEKVAVDTELRKLDQLRAAHLSQQHNIRMQLRTLPDAIGRAEAAIETVQHDISTRNAHDDEDFSMTVGGKLYAGKGAREAAGRALIDFVMASRHDTATQLRGSFRGFEIISRGRPAVMLDLDPEDAPGLFVRGKGTYSAKLNPDSPQGTMQSIEHALRALDKLLDGERDEVRRLTKNLTDYQGQAGKPFEHEARLRDLIGRQAQLNALLDLDKSDGEVAAPADNEPEAAPTPLPSPTPLTPRRTGAPAPAM